METESVMMTPVGYIRLRDETKEKHYEYPFQGYSDTLKYKVELLPGKNFEQALEDLGGFSHIWLIFWFHESKGWNPKSLPPRGPVRKRGVFATRSPYRPNPLGMTLVKLEKIEGRTLFVTGGDFIDGTPLLDIKPFIGRGDCAEDARFGWLEEVEEYRFDVVWEKDAEKAAREIEKSGSFGIRKYAEKTLSYTREPHPYMRISREDGKLVLAVKNIRIFFRIDEADKKVVIEAVREEE